MTGLSARRSSASEALAVPAGGELHLWLCRRETATGGSGQFLREVLSRYAGVIPAQLRFSRGPQGKPALAAPAMPLDFNLSDSGDWLALVVSDGAGVGVDIEYCDPDRDVLKLARRCFSAAELADLQACSPAQRMGRFYDYWTLKEAHIKAAGGSLGRELESTAFALQYPGVPAGSTAIGRIAPLGPAPLRPAWYCLLQPFVDYRLALCCVAPEGSRPDLRVLELDRGAVAIDPQLVLRAVSSFPQCIPEAACL